MQDKYPSFLAAGGTTLSALRGFPAASTALFPVSDLHKDSMLVSVPRRLAQDCQEAMGAFEGDKQQGRLFKDLVLGSCGKKGGAEEARTETEQ